MNKKYKQMSFEHLISYYFGSPYLDYFKKYQSEYTKDMLKKEIRFRFVE